MTHRGIKRSQEHSGVSRVLVTCKSISEISKRFPRTISGHFRGFQGYSSGFLEGYKMFQRALWALLEISDLCNVDYWEGFGAFQEVVG